jgi:hydrogenase maturation protease
VKRPVVIGYGNPLRGDDGIGWRAAEILRSRVTEDLVEVIQCHQLTPEVAASLEGAPLVIFLDAGVDLAAGEISEEMVAKSEGDAWSHRLTPGQLLSFVERLYDDAPPAMLIRGGMLSIAPGDGLSEIAAGCAAQMADLAIKTLLKGL